MADLEEVFLKKWSVGAASYAQRHNLPNPAQFLRHQPLEMVINVTYCNCLCLSALRNFYILAVQREMSGDHHHMIVQPSRFQWNKFKDLLHYYVFLGLIPITAVVMYCNIFIGPAQLEEIPEGYEPKHWEYHKV